MSGGSLEKTQTKCDKSVCTLQKIITENDHTAPPLAAIMGFEATRAIVNLPERGCLHNMRRMVRDANVFPKITAVEFQKMPNFLASSRIKMKKRSSEPHQKKRLILTARYSGEILRFFPPSVVGTFRRHHHHCYFG